MTVRLKAAIPALPARSVEASAVFYRDRLGFEIVHQDTGFAVLQRDDAQIHLWQADDESWRKRLDAERPVCSGAESFIAGTASCRIETEGVAELYPSCEGVLHPSAALTDTDYGTTEFGVLDPDGNLVSFFEWR